MSTKLPDLNREPSGQFKPGESGNPQGRPKGVADKRVEMRKLLEPRANELINKAVELALNGDVQALRLCLERLVPKATGQTISFPLEDGAMNDTKGVLKAGTQLLEDVAAGKLTVEQGHMLSEILQSHFRTLEMVDINARLKALEEANGLNER